MSGIINTYLLTRRTPPLRSFLKVPLPRPPAKTCAFNTKLLVLSFLAISWTSLADVATPNLKLLKF